MKTFLKLLAVAAVLNGVYRFGVAEYRFSQLKDATHSLLVLGTRTLCVLSPEWDGPWVQVDGQAEVLDLPEALEPLVDYYRSISGEHPDWAEYRAAMVRQGKALLRVTITGWGPIATGGFPAEIVDKF